MANIQNELNNIKTALYGKDVRNSIHDAIKTCYDDASVNNDNANMEVKLARGTHNTLNDRLCEVDEKQNSLSSQLEQSEINISVNGCKKSDKSYDNSVIINDLFKKGSTVFIPDGVWYCQSKITIPYNKTLRLSDNAELVMLSNKDFIEFRNSAKLKGGTIKVSNSAYNSSCIIIDGNAKIDNGFIYDTIIIAQDNEGNAINTGTGVKISAYQNDHFVSFFTMNNVRIQYFNTCLLLDSPKTGGGYVNGNLFSNIKLVGGLYMLKFGVTDNVDTICNGNRFTNMQFQDINQKTKVMLLLNGGHQNIINNSHFWDIPNGSLGIEIKKHAYFNSIEHNLSYNYDEVVKGYFEENKNTQTINGYKEALYPHDVGKKNIGAHSTRWNNIYCQNIDALQAIRSHGILENESPVDDNGYTWRARLGASKWGYISLTIIKSKDDVDTVVKELRLFESGDILPNMKTTNLGNTSDPFNMVYANYLSLRSIDGSRWTINVSNDGLLSTTKI